MTKSDDKLHGRDESHPGLDVIAVNSHPRIRLRKARVVGAVEETLREHNVSAALITVILLEDEELLKMNREFLGHNFYTDVITFPLESHPLEGEIYISVDRAKEQAAEFSVTLHEEVQRLAIHGALHLVGFDDKTLAERDEMRRREDEVLGRLKR